MDLRTAAIPLVKDDRDFHNLKPPSPPDAIGGLDLEQVPMEKI